MTESKQERRPDPQAIIQSAESRAVLLVFWALWHMRSRELLAEAQALAEQHADELMLVAINVDHDPELAMQYGLRSVPLAILFQEGQELGRTPFVSGGGALSVWLWRHGVACSAMPAGFAFPPLALQGGAFHGDAGLKARLISTLRERVRNGAITQAYFPCWQEGRGTISGALADSPRADLIEARSGLPFSFACVLELLSLEWSESTIDAVFGEILPGSDLGMLAPRFVQGVFSDPSVSWRGLINDDQIDLLRQQWLRLLDRYVCGHPVSQAEWDGIVIELGMLRSLHREPSRSVQDAFIDLIGTLSPPPAHDDGMWGSALLMHGIYLLHVIVQYDLGWTAQDFAFEGERGQWFIAREQQQPGGRFSEQALLAAQRDWIAQRGEAQDRYDELLQESSANFPLLGHRLRQRLIGLLREAAERASASASA